MSERCKAVNNRGLPCQAWAGADGYCFYHSPSRERERAQAGRVGGVVSKRLRGLAPVGVGSVSDLLPLLSLLIDDVLAGELKPTNRARAIVALAGCYAAIATGSELERRVARLEAQTNERDSQES